MIATENELAGRCAKAHCRSCRQPGLLPVLDLGKMPLSDGFLREDQLAATERLYPLEVAFCPHCSLVQILETVPPEVLFCEDYPYYSSFSADLLEHSRKNALNLIKTRGLNEHSLVVELASNDGYLLKNFLPHGIPVLGIDPADGPARAAERIGVSTLCAFFDLALAKQMSAAAQRADVVIANNVLAHVADTNGFVEGIREILKDDGVAVIEAPYVRELIEHCEFDTIYHEHLCYFSVTALTRLFEAHQLHLCKVERLSIHGGSLRLYVARQGAPDESVQSLLREEAQLGMDRYEYYQQFGYRVEDVARNLRQLLLTIKKQRKTIAAYGAAAKGTILLNYVHAGSDIIDFAVDRNVHKQGKYIPGVRIPISAPDRIAQESPDYVLILPWNFKDEILRQQEPYKLKGGQFIIPIPSPVIV